VRRVRLVDQQAGGIDDLRHIMRRDAGCHADRNAVGAIGQEIGEQAGKDLRLLFLAIIGGAKVDRAFLKARHQVGGGLGQPRLGIAHGRGVIAVDIAEIALPVDQRRAEGKVLREADHRIIDRLVAMGVIFADHVADDARAFLVSGRVARRVRRQHIGIRAARLQLQQAHRPEQPAMDRLQAVAQVRQRACRDRGQRIDEITLGQRLVERMVFDGVERIAKIGHRAFEYQSPPRLNRAVSHQSQPNLVRAQFARA
jgi:hypothetical protein